MVTSLPRIHVALMGIEKVIPSMSDLVVFLAILARSATGQKLSSYTALVRGPRLAGELEGPEEFHLILLDNGRARQIASTLREALYCLRCGACLNVCPVYRQIDAHPRSPPGGGQTLPRAVEGAALGGRPRRVPRVDPPRGRQDPGTLRSLPRAPSRRPGGCGGGHPARAGRALAGSPRALPAGVRARGRGVPSRAGPGRGPRGDRVHRAGARRAEPRHVGSRGARLRPGAAAHRPRLS